MAKKRFTDIEIWDREWYMELKPVHKCLMKYIFDKCDACGCWKPNWRLASLHIGEKVDFADLKQLPKHQYEVLENGKVFIPDFIKFQYGKLSEKSPAHNPVFLAIDNNNLSDRVFNRLYNSPKEKEKEKEEEEYKEKGVQGVKKKLDTATFPIASSLNGLPEDQIENAIVGVRISQNFTITKKEVNALWGNFKIENITGKKYYANIEEIHTHFQRWIKKSPIHNGTANKSSTATNSRNSGSIELLEEIKRNANK